MVDSLGGFKKAVHSNEWAAFFCALKEHFLSAHFYYCCRAFLVGRTFGCCIAYEMCCAPKFLQLITSCLSVIWSSFG